MKTGIKNMKSTTLITSFLLRFIVFSAGWMVLVGGQKIGDIWFIVLFIATTTVISIISVPPDQWIIRPLGVIRFLPYFLYSALRGGWDVARRVFFRNIPIEPGFLTIDHDTDERKTLLLAWVISLLPGTASVVISEKTILVHVLDKKLPVTEEIKELQSRINEILA